jgi:hypothetical protein
VGDTVREAKINLMRSRGETFAATTGFPATGFDSQSNLGLGCNKTWQQHLCFEFSCFLN